MATTDPVSSSDADQTSRKGLTARAAHWSAEHRKVAIWGFLAFVVVAFALGNALGTNQLTSLDQYTGESHDAEQALDDAGLRPIEEVVLVKSDTLTIDDPQFQAAMDDVTGRISKLQYIENVESPLDGPGGDVSEDGHAALVNFVVAGDSVEAKDRVDPSLAATAAVQAEHPDLVVEQFGGASAEKAINETINDDIAKAGELSLPITLIILTLTFGTLVAAGLPLLVGLASVIAAIGLVAIPSQLLPIDGNVNAVILMIGLAVGVDYSLFYLRREREERAAGHDERSALEIAAATSGRAVLISGLTVLVAMAGMFISGDKAFISFAYGTMIVVAIAVFASLTVLPAMLAWLGDRVEKGRIPFVGWRRRPAGQSRFWSALTDRVTRRPWGSIALAGGVLVALAIPALHMKTVISGVDDLPQDLAVIKTYNTVKTAFPSEGVTTTVVVEAPDVRSGDTTTAITALKRQVDKSDSFLPGTAVTYSDDNTVAEIDIPTKGSGTDTASTNALAEVRDQIVPTTVGSVDGTTVNVSGDAAQSSDSRDQSNSRLPLIFAFVFGLAFMLMLVTFRSIVIPIKAILLNLLSVGAAYGVLVLVFQEGHGESLLDFTSNGGVASWLPLFLFVILFGLSMDYHVFILSRVRELYDGGMSTRDAVRQAISSTAGTVTSAALVMVAVFLVFATRQFIDLKELGLGLAAAVFIDATLVRGVLLPASMSVLGDWNWYLPRWLEWLPRLGSDGDEEPAHPRPPEKPAEPAPEPAPV
jgi:RND superfamily putative drug exporter